MARFAILLAFTFYMQTIFAQDLSGKWYGNYGKTFLSTNVDELIVELELYNDSLIRGTTKLFYSRNNYEHYVIKGVYSKEDSTIFFREVSEIEVRLGTLNSNVMGNYTMKLKDYGGVLRFEGKWRDNKTGLMQMMATSVWIQKLPPIEVVPPKEILNDYPVVTLPAVTKITQPVHAAIPLQHNFLTHPKLMNIASDKKQAISAPDTNLKRNTTIDHAIGVKEIETDSVKIEVYDNAKIDGDIISIYVDDNPVLYKKGINEIPLVFYVTLNKALPVHTIKMTAESYGSMPPCTAHITITAGKQKYEFDLESYFDKNAAFTLRLDQAVPK
ncbi:MAG: hypothetical protein H6550_10755 [Chitinophagales bacterium]|nr:hypothetical protein [Chitinophagales bacterium]